MGLQIINKAITPLGQYGVILRSKSGALFFLFVHLRLME